MLRKKKIYEWVNKLIIKKLKHKHKWNLKHKQFLIKIREKCF